MDQSVFLLECVVNAAVCFLGALIFHRSKPWATWFNTLSVRLYQRLAESRSS